MPTRARKSTPIRWSPFLLKNAISTLGRCSQSVTRRLYAGFDAHEPLNSCGGFTEYANRRAVRIIRGQQVIVVDCVKAVGTIGADPPVYPGDQIYVPRTMF